MKEKPMFLFSKVANFFHPQDSVEPQRKNIPSASDEEASIRAEIPQTTDEAVKIWMDCVRNRQIGWGNPIEDLERDAPDYMTTTPYNSPGTLVLVRTEQPKKHLLSNQQIQLTENNLNHYPFLQKMNPQDYQEICMHHMLNQLSVEVVNNYMNAPDLNPADIELHQALQKADIQKKGDMFNLSYEKLAEIRQLLADKLPELCPDFNQQCQQLPSYPQNDTIPPLTSFQKYQIVCGCEDGLIYDVTSENIREDIVKNQLFMNRAKERINQPPHPSNILPQVTVYGDKSKIKRIPLNSFSRPQPAPIDKLPPIPSPSAENNNPATDETEQQYLNRVKEIMQQNHKKIAELRNSGTQRPVQATETARDRTARLHELRFATAHKENRNPNPTVIDAETMNHLITLRTRLHQ